MTIKSSLGSDFDRVACIQKLGDWRWILIRNWTLLARSDCTRSSWSVSSFFQPCFLVLSTWAMPRLCASVNPRVKKQFQAYSQIFIAANREHRCKIPEFEPWMDRYADLLKNLRWVTEKLKTLCFNKDSVAFRWNDAMGSKNTRAAKCTAVIFRRCRIRGLTRTPTSF